MKNIVFIILICLFPMCNSSKQLPVGKANAPLVIYKTKANYSNNVPVIMNAQKDKIVSYPSMNDLFLNGKLALPDKLDKGYLLDNIGISVNSVYTSYTLEEYSKLEKVPSIEELLESIIDFDPFIEIYNCGNQADFETLADVNKIIKNKFKTCSRLK